MSEIVWRNNDPLDDDGPLPVWLDTQGRMRLRVETAWKRSWVIVYLKFKAPTYYPRYWYARMEVPRNLPRKEMTVYRKALADMVGMHLGHDYVLRGTV